MFAFQRYQPRVLRSSVTDPSARASETMAQAAGTTSRIRPGSKTVTKGPEPTAGGAIMAGISGFGAGAAIADSAAGAAALGAGASFAAPVVAALAIGSYLFS